MDKELLKRLAVTLSNALVNLKLHHAPGCDARICPSCRAARAAVARTKSLVPDWETVDPFALEETKPESQTS